MKKTLTICCLIGLSFSLACKEKIEEPLPSSAQKVAQKAEAKVEKVAKAVEEKTAPKAAASAPASKPAAPKAPGTTAATRDHVDEDGVVRRGTKLSTTSVISVDDCSKKSKDLSGKIVKVEGRVNKVCTKKGCWFSIASKDRKESIRITAKDYGFFVPSKSVGKSAIVEGMLEVKEMSQEEARHMAKDGGKDQKTIDAIKGPQKELRIVSQSLEMRG